MLSHVQHLAPVRELIVVAADDAVQVKPAELDGEDVLEHRSQEERGQGDAQHREDHDAVIELAVLVSGGLNAQWDAGNDLQEQCDDV